MNRLIKTTVLVSASLLLVGTAGVVPGLTDLARLQAAAKADGQSPSRALTIDVAVDCRTIVSGVDRGSVFLIAGKIFPAGALPSGTVSNDPAQPVNGVEPIGEFLGRGQHTLPLPPVIAPFYSSAIGDFATQYFIFDNGITALTAEGYAFLQGPLPAQVLLAVTGGIGRFRGASGDIRGASIGTNITGCPNFRTTINLLPGSTRAPAVDGF